MCGSTVKPAKPASQEKQKPPVYMRNAFLDGLGINAENHGRNALRIEPGSPVPVAPAPVTPDLGIGLPPVTPPGGRGGAGRGGNGLGIGGPNRPGRRML